MDAANGDWITTTYNTRVHSETGQPPVASWRGEGWLPQIPDNLEDLALLLVMAAKLRVVRRDGGHFQGLRFMSPTLAPYVNETGTIRYDPRDLTEVRVFHQNRFLCRAISPDRETESVSLKDIQTARSAHRRTLRRQIKDLVGHRMGTFIVIKEHRRFVEFVSAVRKHRYIGICFGPAVVGKTVSAQRHAKWDKVGPLLDTWGRAIHRLCSPLPSA